MIELFFTFYDWMKDVNICMIIEICLIYSRNDYYFFFQVRTITPKQSN